VRYPLDLLAGDRALGPARPLFGVLVHEPPSWGLDDPGLVGLGGVAVPLPVREPLHHGVDLSLPLPLSVSARGAAAAAADAGSGRTRLRRAHQAM